MISNLNQIRESESAARRRGCDCLTSWATSDYSARSLYLCICVCTVCHFDLPPSGQHMILCEILSYLSSSYRILQKLGWVRMERLRWDHLGKRSLFWWIHPQYWEWLQSLKFKKEFPPISLVSRYDDYKDPVTGQKYIVDHAPHTEMAAYEKRVKPQPPLWNALKYIHLVPSILSRAPALKF